MTSDLQHAEMREHGVERHVRCDQSDAGGGCPVGQLCSALDDLVAGRCHRRANCHAVSRVLEHDPILAMDSPTVA